MSMKAEIVQLLQNEMGRIVVDRATRVIAGALVEHLEGNAVAYVLAWMDLVAEVDARFLIGVEDRTPATREFVERGLDQARRPLRPGIKEGPGQRAGKADAAGETEAAGRLRGLHHLVYRPDLTFLRLAPDCRRRESVEGFVVGRMNRDELSLQVGGQFGDHQAMARGHAGNFIAIGLRGCGLVEVDQARIGGRDLNALVTEPSRPAADGIEAVKRRRIADELRQKNRGPLHGGRLISR